MDLDLLKCFFRFTPQRESLNGRATMDIRGGCSSWRNRRVGEVHATRPAAQMAGVERVRRRVQRVEFFSAGERHHEIRQEKKDADGGDVFADSRYRLRGPDGEKYFATAEGRRGSALRPLRVHGVCARRGTRNGSRVGSRALPICGE